MSGLIKGLIAFLLVFSLTGASIDLVGPQERDGEERRRKGGRGCAAYVYSLIDNDYSRIENHGAVEWSIRPVISEGVLTASGTIKDDKEMFTGEGWVIFNVNDHNTDVRVANILKPGLSYSISKNSAVDIHATEWNLDSKSFSFEAPFGVDTPKNLDLIVWGTEVAQQGIPLAAIKIERKP